RRATIQCLGWKTEASTGPRSLRSGSRRWLITMASNPPSGWQPDWTVAPGEILLEALQDRGMTQSELAHRLARPSKTVNEIIKGKAAITPETAIQLERALGISVRFWTGL